jgi:hypothetical protein
MSESELIGFDEFPPHPYVWYSKHKARHRKGVGRWFVMKNDRTVNGFSIARTVVVNNLDTRKAAIAMVKLLESTNGNS